VTRTSPVLLAALAAVGAIGGFVLQLALAATSHAKVLPEFTLALSLVLIAVLLVVLAVPVRRSTRGTRRERIDPFYATRVVMLAKASSIAGALLAGAGVGLLVEVLLRTVAPGDTIVRTIAMLVGAALLLVGALVAEHLCRVPPDRGEDDRDHAAPAA
jgi:hypothetical protein